jgi:hypothetical protein
MWIILRDFNLKSKNNYMQVPYGAPLLKLVVYP